MPKETFFQKLLNAGIHEGLSKKFSNKIRISNRLSVMFLGLAVFYFFVFKYFDQPILSEYTILIGFVQALVIPMNFKRWYNLSRIHMSISNAFIAYTYSGIMGPDSGMSMFYFASFFAPLVRFEKHEKLQLLICYLAVSTIIILDIYLKIHSIETPIFTTEEQHKIFPYVFPATFIMMFFYGRAIIKEQNELETQTLELKRKTEYQNHELVKYNAMLKENESKLLEAKNIAEENVHQKAQFLSTMSHEIRTPLNAIIGISHLLTNQKLSKENNDYINSLHFSAKNLLNLINDILDYNKIESRKLELEEKPIELTPFVEKLIKQHEGKAIEQQNKLKLDLEKSLPKGIKGDEVRLAQILNNLLSNSNKFTKQGLITLSIEQIESHENQSSLRFSVKDNGIGIKKENQEKIFDSFTQEHTSTTRMYGGTGLGLAISKSLVELMGGRLILKSEYQVGTVFSFEIEVEDISNHKFSASTSFKEKSLPENKRILLVEDNQLNTMIAQKFLNEWGITEIDTAENGEIGVDKANDSHSLILMDLQMPKMDGYTAAQEIRQKGLETPIVALTAEALSDVRQKILEHGMNSYVSKPFDPKDLFDTLNKYLSLEN